MMQTEINPESLLTARQVASLLHISTRTLWRLKSAGKLPEAVRIGGSVRWRNTDVSDWIAGGCQAPTSRNNHPSRKD